MQELIPSLDWQRIFIGDEPPIFLLEIVVRTVFVYSYSLALIRWIGGRGIGQMSIVEFLLVVALGSAVGDAMFYPDVPLIHALLVITLVVVINKLIDIAMCSAPRIRHFFAGKSVEVIRDGRINRDALAYLKVSRDELFEGLRERGISNIARVQYGFLEPSGAFSFFRVKGPVKGLQIVPAWTTTFATAQAGKDKACTDCGTVVSAETQVCPTCQSRAWAMAVIDDEEIQ